MIARQKTAWVVGASSGLGAGLAERLAKDGYAVCVSARRAEGLNQLCSTSPQLHAFPLDISDHAATKEIAERILEQHGPIDLFVYAAVYAHADLDAATSLEQAFHVGTLGCAYALKTIIPSMKSNGGGQIAIFGSPVGYDALPGTLRYGTEKAALAYYARSLRIALSKGNIDVKLILPGFVKTPLTAKNSFPMPFLMELPFAIDRIMKGLAKKSKATIAFPQRLHWLMKIIGMLPDRLYFWLMRQIGRKF